MRNRDRWIWIAFICCAALVAAAMLWLTRSVVHSEKERAEAEIRAELQERVRLSLWRMDSLGASLLLEENAIPPEQFLNKPESLLPHRARFRSEDGISVNGTGDKVALALCAQLLPNLKEVVKKQAPLDLEDQSEGKKNRQNVNDYYVPQKSKIRGGKVVQETANVVEKTKRDAWLLNTLPAPRRARAKKAEVGLNLQEQLTDLRKNNSRPINNFRPLWFKDSLFLVQQGGNMTSAAQGILLDHEKLMNLLLAEILRELPEAKLVKVKGNRSDSLALASFPFQLVPGSIGFAAGSIPEEISASLFVGWLAVIIALVAAYLLISNVMELSERRASFVSAVTHELRTPLTTFRLYSDMLSNNAVQEEKRPKYLKVLSREADRLSHLVENVLAFSQVERGSARSKVSDVELNALLESFRERFTARLDSSEMKLETNFGKPVQVKLDESLLEHILFNLIDNAAKYASTSELPVVSLSTELTNSQIKISVSDHGPGISDLECKKIFQPFHKSAEQAAETKPGVGLGLALSMRLARAMGGRLSCESRASGETGAVFVLALPA